ncbi:DUF6233 domain-containing protein [Streptomyces sp. NPDC056441]|uniref:DUF6233 domain-containing protein n=1 Tax=Streptomyces sp. NPDC056441 TaxID=3345817 RepID=UPI00369B2ABD
MRTRPDVAEQLRMHDWKGLDDVLTHGPAAWSVDVETGSSILVLVSPDVSYTLPFEETAPAEIVVAAWRRPPVEVHAGHCHAAGKRRRTIDRDQARALLADGVRACAHCRPDTDLGVLG